MTLSTPQIDTYLQRLAYAGPVEPSLRALHALTRTHSQAVPFENLHVLLHRPVLLDCAALYHKIVLEHRGGYCFELNGLFLELLRGLGFTATPLGARVRLGVDDRAQLTRRTHMLVAVTLGRETWLSDVGVGAASLTCALCLEAGRVQHTPHDTRRLTCENGRWFHQRLHGDHWEDVYEFTLDPMPQVDRDVASWFTSTNPTSHFCTVLTVARAQADGGRLTLRDDCLRHHPAGGAPAQEHTLPSAAALRQSLRRHFNLDLNARDTARVWQIIHPESAQATPADARGIP